MSREFLSSQNEANPTPFSPVQGGLHDVGVHINGITVLLTMLEEKLGVVLAQPAPIIAAPNATILGTSAFVISGGAISGGASISNTGIIANAVNISTKLANLAKQAEREGDRIQRILDRLEL